MSGEVVSSARSQADVTITMLLEAIQLDQLRSFAQWVASHSYAGARGASLYSLWRLQLERALVHEIADVTFLALGHSAGLEAARRNRRNGLRR